jgi:Family of unknown function (DUF6162)
MEPLRQAARWWRRPQSAAIRTVEVQPPSHADEASWVFLTGGFILLCVIYVVAFERDGLSGADARASSARALLPYQVLFRDLPSDEQRVFRAMQEGAGEAVRVRAARGSWPEVEALAADGIPPFAPDVLDKAGRQWRSAREGLVVNYAGLPSAPSAAAFLIFIQEPDPVTGEKAPPPSVVDEEHQLLPDGTLLHVTYWKHSTAGLRPGTILDPAAAGWQQIRVKTLFEEIEKS